ncbi:MAG: type II toxin-antitoxin system RelE/ParE family toxin [Thermoleophilia bacterium]
MAEEDLSEAIAFIAADDPAAAMALADRIEKSLGDLANHPRMGKVPDDPNLIQMGYRYLVVENYLVFYEVETRVVNIHRILHGARNYRDLL